MYQKSVRSQCLIDLWHSSKETFCKMFPSLCVRNVLDLDLWQNSDSFLLTMFPKLLCFWWPKCVWKVSERGKMTEFWHIIVWQVDTILTHLWILTVFWYIFLAIPTLFWHIFGNDRLLTVYWHISDSYLTELQNWQISDSFLTVKWHIFKIHGTSKRHEYRKICSSNCRASSDHFCISL